MSREQVKRDAGRLQRPDSVIRCVDDGENIVIILEPYTIPVGGVYTPTQLDALAFVARKTYPDVQPDESGFYVKPFSLVLSTSNSPPASTSQAELLGDKWLKFSWKWKGPAWDPETDSLETFLSSLESRFFRRS